MEAESALVGTDGAVHLNAEATVYLNISLIVEPGHSEHHYAFGFDDPLQDARLTDIRDA
jgi:hypothetical protein